MSNNILKSHAKINLFLNVGKKLRKKNLHNIQSLVFLINLHDEIYIKKNKSKKDEIKFLGKFSKKINAHNNSIKTSLHLLRKKKFIDKKNYYKIIIKKNIPVFSGLGGGSSNSASIIKHFCKKKVSQNNINYFARYIGSDLPLFLKSKRTLQKNLLTFKSFKKNYKFYFLLIFPFIKCSTKEIYSKYRVNYTTKKKLKFSYKNKSKFVNSLKLTSNSLHDIVTNKFPVISDILKEVEFLKGCQLSRITGSGSACFGLFLNKRDATLAKNQIRKKFPNFWCNLSKTI